MPMMGPGCYGMPGGQMMGQQGYSPMAQQGYSPMAQQPQAFGAMPTFVNPKFYESWTPPPPPTTPPVLEHDEERERMANARAESKDA
jgi:hypothetical protein